MLIPVQLNLRKETFKKFEENICFLIFCLFFFPKYFIRVVSRMSNYPLSNSFTPELTTKIELTQRYEFKPTVLRILAGTS